MWQPWAVQVQGQAVALAQDQAVAGRMLRQPRGSTRRSGRARAQANGQAASDLRPPMATLVALGQQLKPRTALAALPHQRALQAATGGVSTLVTTALTRAMTL